MCNIISFSSALHIDELGPSAKCHSQLPEPVLQTRALRAMPSQLSGADRDKHTRFSKIDRDSKEWEKPEGIGTGEGLLSIRSGKENAAQF